MGLPAHTMSGLDTVTPDEVRALLKVDVPHSVFLRANDPKLYRQCVVLLTTVRYQNAAHFNEAIDEVNRQIVSDILAHITPDVEDPGSALSEGVEAAGSSPDTGTEAESKDPDADVGEPGSDGLKAARPRDTTFNGCEVTVIDGPPGSLDELRSKLQELQQAGQESKNASLTDSDTAAEVEVTAAQGGGAGTRLHHHKLDRLVVLTNAGLSEARVAELAEVIDLIVHCTVGSGTMIEEVRDTTSGAKFKPAVGDTVLLLRNGGVDGEGTLASAADDDDTVVAATEDGDEASVAGLLGVVDSIDAETGLYSIKIQDGDDADEDNNEAKSLVEGVSLDRLIAPPQEQVRNP